MNRLVLLVFLVLHLSTANGLAVDPEAYMTAPEMIRRWGYPVEIHDVVTPDGYILSLFRIPHGRFSGANTTCQRPAVLMVHGFGASAPEFILNPPESSPAFIMADAGFDVFLANQRGSMYAKRHITLKPWDNKYWQFTVDEMAKYDLPSSIDKVLQITGQDALYWVGSSQGTLVGFMMLADSPQYNSKVKALFQVGPVGTTRYSKGLFAVLIWAYEHFKPLCDFYRIVLGSHEVSQGITFIYRPLIELCLLIPGIGPEVCKLGLQFIAGPPAATMNISRVPVYLSHIPSGSSTWNALHLAQIASHFRVEHMDHNPLENLQRYGQETPPPYNYSNIASPVYLFWSKNDWATTWDDIEKYLLVNLRKEVVKGVIEMPGYNHFDPAIATDNAEKVWNPIVKIIRDQETNDICMQ